MSLIISLNQSLKPNTRHFESDNYLFKSNLSEKFPKTLDTFPVGWIKALLICALLSIGLMSWPALARQVGEESPAKKPQYPFGLFGSLEFRTNNMKQLKQWTAVVRRTRKEMALYRRCAKNQNACSAKMRAWRVKLDELRRYRGRRQLSSLNRFINSLWQYRTDNSRFGRRDYWASPAEFLKGSGDCEDYAIIKFFSLLELGYSNSDMRIVVVRDVVRGIAHAVLTVNLGAKTYVLDNLSPEPKLDRRLMRYWPIYSVNLNTRWAHITTRQIRKKYFEQRSAHGLGEKLRTPRTPVRSARR